MQRPSTFSRLSVANEPFVVTNRSNSSSLFVDRSDDDDSSDEFCVRDSSPLQSKSNSHRYSHNNSSSTRPSPARRSRSWEGPDAGGRISTRKPKRNVNNAACHKSAFSARKSPEDCDSMRERRRISMEEFLEGKNHTRNTRKSTKQKKLLHEAIQQGEKHRKHKSMDDLVSLRTDLAIVVSKPTGPVEHRHHQPHHHRGHNESAPTTPRSSQRSCRTPMPQDLEDDSLHVAEKTMRSPRRKGSRRASRSGEMGGDANPDRTPIVTQRVIEHEFRELFMSQSSLATTPKTPRSCVPSPRHQEVSMETTPQSQPQRSIPFLDNSWFAVDNEEGYDDNDDDALRKSQLYSPRKEYKRALVAPAHRRHSSLSRGRSLRVNHSGRAQRTTGGSDPCMSPKGQRHQESQEQQAPFPLLSNYLGSGGPRIGAAAGSEQDNKLLFNDNDDDDDELVSVARSTGSAFWDEVVARMDRNASAAAAAQEREHRKEASALRRGSMSYRRRNIPEETTNNPYQSPRSSRLRSRSMDREYF